MDDLNVNTAQQIGSSILNTIGIKTMSKYGSKVTNPLSKYTGGGTVLGIAGKYLFNYGLNKFNEWMVKGKAGSLQGVKRPNYTDSFAYAGQLRHIGTVSYTNRLKNYIPPIPPKDITIPPDQYLVKIQAESLDKIITAVLQEEIQMEVDSHWQPFIPSAVVTPLETVSQFLLGKSLTARFTSRRIWTGTSPVTISLKLKFLAVDDALKDVVTPTRKLQKLVLPSTSTNSGFGVPFLNPPGPSPFDFTDVMQKTFGIKNLTNQGDFITIKIGRFLSFSSVIIRSASVTYPSKLTEAGYPIEAEVNLKFETYEILTKESLDEVYGIKKANG